MSEYGRPGPEENQDNFSIPEARTGYEVARIVEQVFDRAPNLKQYFVDSNVVLTLAGMKGATNFTADVESEQDLRKYETEIETINETLKMANPEVKFAMFKDVKETEDDGKYVTFIVQNLLGYERASKISKISGVTPFDRRTGWDGLAKWSQKLWAQVEAAGYESPEDVALGLELGYPDRAIYDLQDWMKNGSKGEMVDAIIPNTRLYDDHDPSYVFSPGHENDAGIRDNMEKSGRILKEFYDSDWHKKVAPSLAFHRV